MKALGAVVRFGIIAGVTLAVTFVVLRAVVLDVALVSHNGMAPTLMAGDEVLVWRGAGADMGDIMLCEHPSRPQEFVLGRAVAFAGHRVSTDYMGNLSVDDDRTSTTAEGTFKFYDIVRRRQFTVLVGEMSYGGQATHLFMIEEGKRLQLDTYDVNRGVYLLGDNRHENAFDSRAFGEVDTTRCIGQVFLRLKPAPSRSDDFERGYLEVLD